MSNQIKNYNDVGNIVHYNSNNRIFHAFVEHPLFSNHLGLVLHQIIQYELSVALFFIYSNLRNIACRHFSPSAINIFGSRSV